MDWENLRSALEMGHEWPCEYCFKFITKVEGVDRVVEQLGADVRIEKNYSRTGKYVSVSAYKRSPNPDAVIAVYKQVSVVEGVIPL